MAARFADSSYLVPMPSSAAVATGTPLSTTPLAVPAELDPQTPREHAWDHWHPPTASR